MCIRGRRRPIGLIALLLVALASATLAQGDTWRCDTGQLCRGHASGRCCCPPERHAAAEAHFVETSATASSDCCAPASAPPQDRVPCCAARAHEPGSAAAHLESAAHCRCVFTIGTSPEAALEPAARSATPTATEACQSHPILPLPPARAAVIAPRAGDPPPSYTCLPPLGLRAPPASC